VRSQRQICPASVLPIMAFSSWPPPQENYKDNIANAKIVKPFQNNFAEPT